MSRLRVQSFSISLDGYGAGPDQSRENPLGRGGEALHEWVLPTRSWRRMHSLEGGEAGIDDDFAARADASVGVWIIGRNMFGPVRGAWPDESWKGWWGDNPPFRVPVIVLTQFARDPVVMDGGTVFHFFTGGIHAALERARGAANGKDVRIGGGVATIRQYLAEGLIDELHLVVTPVLLGSGEHLFAGIDLPALGYRCTEHVPSSKATHVVLARSR